MFTCLSCFPILECKLQIAWAISSLSCVIKLVIILRKIDYFFSFTFYMKISNIYENGEQYHYPPYLSPSFNKIDIRTAQLLLSMPPSLYPNWIILWQMPNIVSFHPQTHDDIALEIRILFKHGHTTILTPKKLIKLS